MKFLKNEKGFTLVEILVVIAIIAILFVALIPQIDRAVDRARQTGVKTDFRSFQLASETYMRETSGMNMDEAGYNSFLDVGLQTKTGAGSANGTTGTDVGLDSLEKDEWGKEYDVHIYPDVNDKMIVIRSFGPNEKPDVGDTDPGFAKNDDFLTATYYVDGTVASCTKGFSSGDVVSQVLTANAGFECGKKLDGSDPALALKRP